MSLIDNATSMPWAVPLAKKSNAAQALQEWEDERFRETGVRPRIYTTDMGGEFSSAQLKAWFASHGTVHRTTAPHSSAQNGRVERLNRTLSGRMRAMLTAGHLPDYLWSVCMETAAILAAVMPTTANKGRTPHKDYHQSKPNVSHLREIGCRAFVLVEDRHLPKLYNRSIECIMVGYVPNSKAYLLWHQETKRLIKSRNVRFIESHQEPWPPWSVEKTTLTPAPLRAEVIDEEEENMPVIFPMDLNAPKPPETRPDPVTPGADKPSHVPVPAAPVKQPEILAQPRQNAARDGGAARGIPRLDRLNQAVANSIAAGERKAAERAQRKADCEAVLRVNWPSTPDSDVGSKEEIAHLLDKETAALVKDAWSYLEDMALSGDTACAALENPADPRNHAEAAASPDYQKWFEAEQKEISLLLEKKVYKLVKPGNVPHGKTIMGTRPVYTTKFDSNGNIDKHKCCIVCQGFSAVPGLDFDKTTSPTARLESIRTILHVAAVKGWSTRQADVKTAYLNGTLDEPVYMRQPKGLETPGKEHKIMKVFKSLYGMRQAGRIWNQTLNEAMISWGFTQLSVKHCIYYCKRDSGTVIAAVHVDNFAITGNSDSEMDSFLKQLMEKWEITTGDKILYIVGVKVKRDFNTNSIFLSQLALINRIIEGFAQSHATSVKTPLPPGTKLS
jgi:hypothetical protein